ncbi:unnamed protein product [Vitrella brassicaformis CCMP3155]|uniref:malate synthase n=2 Tax=Vitrella brassicaformis TaxID=1169539 RepID=A0A0G4GW22_VITBC|nr:unnamed protein product [Vitrella brassicaformis CCMP3155]|mmetsp:Transcript_35063/g.100871  ORF Transcript_35063/g.100871 Transcript_35063/m.100871 type:complete len:474 (-) Transcript_35063:708-2129(-)|eukprot:CEM35133.1 unnamed protein product [Vitrella brassicaformis CCMP3155]
MLSGAQGVQVDFDDGFCPSWRNVLIGHLNVANAARGQLPGDQEGHTRAATDGTSTVMMVRPRAWNMIEANVMVNGRRVSGALFGFGMFVFSSGRHLAELSRGPFLYLSKLESASEAALWDRIFAWTEEALDIPANTIKVCVIGLACVLIESLPAAFEMDEMLWELRNHSAGLNCGMWDYAASFITRMGHDRRKIFPDRNRYVSMDRHFMKSYRRKVIATCHRRGAPATGGMFAGVDDGSLTTHDKQLLVSACVSAKEGDALAGADGALVYDLSLVQPIQDAFAKHFAKGCPNQLSSYAARDADTVTAHDLLQIPTENDVSLDSLRTNIEVCVRYVKGWLEGRGHLIMNGKVEDSATAEISRAQIWQQIRHGVPFESPPAAVPDADSHSRAPLSVVTHKRHKAAAADRVTAPLVREMIREVVCDLNAAEGHPQEGGGGTTSTTSTISSSADEAGDLVADLVTLRQCPLFITTYL